MADSYIGEIRIFCGSYAPRDWLFCDGQLLLIQQYPALYSIIGSKYGGDGKTNFAIPNLNGMVPVHQGAGPGLTPRSLAETGGSTTVTLTEATIPNHLHQAEALAAQGTTTNPTEATWAQYEEPGRTPIPQLLYNPNVDTEMNPQALSPVGGNQAHNNMQPFLAMNFIISLDGEYPVKP